MLRDMNLPDGEEDLTVIALWQPLLLVRLKSSELKQVQWGHIASRCESTRAQDSSLALLAPRTCPQLQRTLLTFGIVGVREVAAILWTCYICTPESTTYPPFLQSR